MTLRNVIVIATLTITAPLIAAEEEQDEGPWSGKVSLGYLATSGNTNNSSLNSGFEIGYTAGQWQHILDATAIYAEEDDVTVAEAYTVKWKSARDISEHNFLFGLVDWRKDRFSGYDQQFSQAIGYGRRLVDGKYHRLSAEIGVGARQSDLIDGTMEDEIIGRGGFYYRWTMSDTAEFRQGFTVESGPANTYFESVTELSARLLGDLALVASYTVKRNSDVPLGTGNTDTYTALSVEYLF